MPDTPYFSNAAAWLVDTVATLFILMVLLRFLLQLARADFYNPACQFLVKATNPLLRPLRRVVPGMWGIDLASVLLMVVLQMVAVWLAQLTGGHTMGPGGLFLLSLSKLLALALNTLAVTLIVQALMSWINPGSYHPLVSLLYSINEPLLRPVRRMLPDMGGIDFSPLAVLLLIQLAKMLVVAPLRDAAFMLG